MRAGVTLTQLDLRRATGGRHARGGSALWPASRDTPRAHGTQRRGGRSPDEGPPLSETGTPRSLSPAFGSLHSTPPPPSPLPCLPHQRSGHGPTRGTANNGNKPRTPQASKAEHRRRQRERETPPPLRSGHLEVLGRSRGTARIAKNEARAHRPGAARDAADEPPSPGPGKGAQGATRAKRTHTEPHALQQRVRGHGAQAGQPHPCLPHTTTGGWGGETKGPLAEREERAPFTMNGHSP